MGFQNKHQLHRILACPVCKLAITLLESDLKQHCPRCKSQFGYDEHSVVFFSDELPEKYACPEYTSSNPYTWDALDVIKENPNGIVLDLGAGQPETTFPNVVQLEIRKYRATDLVIAGKNIPLQDDSVDGVISLSVLEHVKSPDDYVKEIYRVLKPGGRCILHSAFLQPLHGAPYHYFNTTHHALLHLFSGFSKKSCKAGPHQHPWITLRWFLQSYLNGMTDSDKSSLRQMKVGELESILMKMADQRTEVKKERDPLKKAEALLSFNETYSDVLGPLLRIPDSVVTELSAGFMVDARK